MQRIRHDRAALRTRRGEYVRKPVFFAAGTAKRLPFGREPFFAAMELGYFA